MSTPRSAGSGETEALSRRAPCSEAEILPPAPASFAAPQTDVKMSHLLMKGWDVHSLVLDSLKVSSRY